MLGVLTAFGVGIVDTAPMIEDSAIERWTTAFFVLTSFLLSALIFHGIAVVLRWLAASYDHATSMDVPQAGPTPAVPTAKRDVKIPDGWENRWE